MESASSSAERFPCSNTSAGNEARKGSKPGRFISPMAISFAQFVGSTKASVFNGAAAAVFMLPDAGAPSSFKEVNSKSALRPS